MMKYLLEEDDEDAKRYIDAKDNIKQLNHWDCRIDQERPLNLHFDFVGPKHFMDSGGCR